MAARRDWDSVVDRVVLGKWAQRADMVFQTKIDALQSRSSFTLNTVRTARRYCR